MGFVKDGETKVYKDKVIKTGKDQQDKRVEKARYTVDDLVRDTEGPEEESEFGDEDDSY
jgi:hypothetical protein